MRYTIDNIVKENMELLEFIRESPTSYQTVSNVAKKLTDAGIAARVRNGSSLIAHKCQDKAYKGVHIIAAHTDSPMFKLKENAEQINSSGYVKLNVEKYGGMIVNTWLDRPLSVAGRVVVDNGGKLESHNVDLKEPLYIIPNLAIHMSRGMEDKPLSIQTDLQPIGETGLLELVCDNINVGKCKTDILGMDLYLYNCQQGVLAGRDKSMVCTARLDDLQCVYAAYTAFMETESEDYINVLALFDNEEVGSLSRQGAASDFLSSVIKEITQQLGISGRAYDEFLENSFMISADNAHAIHPNHPEKADIVNRPELNKGIVIKYHGGLKYTTDAYSGAYVKQICKKNDIPYQIYHNNSDVAGGSTLGNLVQANVSIPSADIGLAQLAMHSSYETAGSRDTVYMIEFMKAFYS